MVLNSGTIHRWIRAYAPRLHRLLNPFKPKLRGSIHADEVIVNVRGARGYDWGAIDKLTRYKISGPLTSTRSYRLGAAPLYEKLKDRCEGHPPRIVTDKLGHYRRAFNKYFHRTGVRMVHGVPIACRRRGLKHNNNPIERKNQRVKTRTKTRRAFKTQPSCKRFLYMLDLMHNMHNFIKASMALNGGYPAERASIKLPLGRDGLLSLIQILATGI
jgi:transposase-like protein